MALEFQNNPSPSLLMVEAADETDPTPDALPAAGQQRLIVGPDHLLYLLDDTGTATQVGGGTGLTDPMTTRGDIIVRNASNVTARLGRGSATHVLTSDGTDIGWAAPSGGGFTPAVGVVNLNSGNVTSTSSTFVDITGCTITMTTGAHRVLLGFSGSIENSAVLDYVMLDFLVDGTQQFGGASGRQWRAQAANAAEHGDMTFLTAALTAGSHTFKVQWKEVGGTGTMLLRADGTNYAAQFWAIEQGV